MKFSIPGRRLWLALLITGCAFASLGAAPSAPPASVPPVSPFRIYIITDTQEEFSVGIQQGLRASLDKLLAAKGRSALWEVRDTQLDETRIPAILAELKRVKPDLVCTINYPTVFADTYITKVLTGPEWRFVSENCIPVESAIIKTWEKPGGNVTGVGVFQQQNSFLRLMKLIDPKKTKLVFYSWDQMSLVNRWFRQEIERACLEEGVKLVEFREVKSQEDTLALYQEYADRWRDHFFLSGISAFVNARGEAVSLETEIAWKREHSRLISLVYDENDARMGEVGGPCVIWTDLGTQMAEKAVRILLDGISPGTIPWDYPRKYNLIFNRKRIESLGLKINPALLGAAYRIYTDYQGSFVGTGR